MGQRERCTGTTQAGDPCGSFAVRDGLCVSHHPELRDRKAEGSRRGGANRAEARRAARAFAAAGDVVSPADLPAMLRGAMLSVWDGSLEPSQAQAIAALAKTSVSLSQDLEMEQRIAALEDAAGIAPAGSGLRRVK